jgi:hypothetical protein
LLSSSFFLYSGFHFCHARTNVILVPAKNHKKFKLSTMKKLIFAALMLVSVSSFTYANPNIVSYLSMRGDGQHISASQVPAAVKATFAGLYPTATNVRWQIEKEHGSTVYQASFLLNGVRTTAFFAPDGRFLGQK